MYDDCAGLGIGQLIESNQFPWAPIFGDLTDPFPFALSPAPEDLWLNQDLQPQSHSHSQVLQASRASALPNFWGQMWDEVAELRVAHRRMLRTAEPRRVALLNPCCPGTARDFADQLFPPDRHGVWEDFRLVVSQGNPQHFDEIMRAVPRVNIANGMGNVRLVRRIRPALRSKTWRDRATFLDLAVVLQDVFPGESAAYHADHFRRDLCAAYRALKPGATLIFYLDAEAFAPATIFTRDGEGCPAFAKLAETIARLGFDLAPVMRGTVGTVRKPIFVPNPKGGYDISANHPPALRVNEAIDGDEVPPIPRLWISAEFNETFYWSDLTGYKMENFNLTREELMEDIRLMLWEAWDGEFDFSDICPARTLMRALDRHQTLRLMRGRPLIPTTPALRRALLTEFILDIVAPLYEEWVESVAQEVWEEFPKHPQFADYLQEEFARQGGWHTQGAFAELKRKLDESSIFPFMREFKQFNIDMWGWANDAARGEFGVQIAADKVSQDANAAIDRLYDEALTDIAQTMRNVVAHEADRLELER